MKRAFTPIPVMLGAILMTTAAPCAEGADSDRAYPIAVQQSVGSWTLIAANDQEGSFHHCELSQQQGDYQLSFLRGTAGYVLVVANAAWQLPEGATYQVSLDGDGLNPVDFKASTAGTGIIILLGDDWPLVAKMREIGTLRLHAAKAVIPLAMDEAAAGLDQLEACWTERTGAVSNPFADADAGATDANPFATGLADTAATGAGGFSIDASGIAASGSNFSAAEIGKMFEGDFARFAELTADTITVPEITTRFSGADENAQSVEVVYRDVRMSGVDRGEAAGSEVGSIELRSGETSVTLDHLSTGQLNIDGLLAFYGLVPSDQDADAPQLLYKDFAIGGVRIDLPGGELPARWH